MQRILAVVFVAACASTVQAQWDVRTATDPVTDEVVTTGVLIDESGGAALVVRCINGKLDFVLIASNSTKAWPSFGLAQVTVRWDQEDATEDRVGVSSRDFYPRNQERYKDKIGKHQRLIIRYRTPSSMYTAIWDLSGTLEGLNPYCGL